MNEFVIKNKVCATADSKMNNVITKQLWQKFCIEDSEIEITAGEKNTFVIGNVQLPELKAECEYAICVTSDGVAIVGKDYPSLMRGFYALLMKIEYTEQSLTIRAVNENGNYRIKNRMIHICVFPENDLYFIKKLIRLSALCQYTHIVIEFWGMLKYDCLKELAWPNAFSKSQAKELIDECRMLGIEPIPMFNQLGHATACRLVYGKHVALDQNPRLQYLFTPDGWAWNIHSDKVAKLLRDIRAELYELFGEGEYMHIGCDEAYYYTRCDEERKKMPEFLKKLTDEVVAEGRRPMLWMDMLLERGKYDQDAKATATCKPEEVEVLQGALNPKTVMVDWQYDIAETPIKSHLSLKDNVCDAMGAPWYDRGNYTASVNTIAEHNMFGVMMTTWHTLYDKMPSILGCAKQCGAKTFTWSDYSGLREETATLMRRVSFEGNTYADCGWCKEQIEI